jgi:hypothetical protein
MPAEPPSHARLGRLYDLVSRAEGVRTRQADPDTDTDTAGLTNRDRQVRRPEPSNLLATSSAAFLAVVVSADPA